MYPSGARADHTPQTGRSLAISRRDRAQTYAAGVPPAAASILQNARRPPLPGPLKLNGLVAHCRIIAHQFNIWVFVQVGVRVEFSGHQVFQLFAAAREQEGEAIDDGVHGRKRADGDGGIARGLESLGLAEDKGEVEGELIVVQQADQEAGRPSGRGFGVLSGGSQCEPRFFPRRTFGGAPERIPRRCRLRSPASHCTEWRGRRSG